MSGFDEQILALARAQATLRDLEDEYKPYLMQLTIAKNQAKTLEESLRGEALDWFKETGEKSLHEAMNVKLVKRKHYNTPLNLARALQNDPGALCIDPDAFKASAGVVAQLLNDLEGAEDEREELGLLRQLEGLVRDVLAIDERVAKGQSWAVPMIEEVPTVFLQAKLSQYLIFDEFERRENAEKETANADKGSGGREIRKTDSGLIL